MLYFLAAKTRGKPNSLLKESKSIYIFKESKQFIRKSRKELVQYEVERDKKDRLETKEGIG